MIQFVLNNINSSFQSYQNLINFYETYKSTKSEQINLSIKQWFSANISSALGGILDRITSNYNVIRFENIPDNIKSIIQKNNFLSYYGYPSISDIHSTTIKYLKLKPTDGRYFNNYVFTELLNRPEMPSLSQGLRKKIAESIYEIFVNAQLHSESEFIYTCGQFYPKNHIIEFTITDTGLGFKNKINSRFNSSMTSRQAIKWAIKDGHSTKQNVPGGIGLAILQEFIKLNNGILQIVSDDGYYHLEKDKEYTQLFNGSFPGTIVNMQFKTDDVSSYILKGEIDSTEIF